MSLKRTFRILVIDDSPEVIDRVVQRVANEQHSFGGIEWSVDIGTVLVKIIDNNGQYSISMDTMEELAAECAKCPNVIFADYGYANRDLVHEIENEYNGVPIPLNNIAQYTGKVFTIRNLVERANEYMNDPSKDSAKRSQLKKNFLNYNGILYLYTYKAREFQYVFGDIHARETATANAQRKWKVKLVDTRCYFYGDDRFDDPNRTIHDWNFYAHLVTGYIDQRTQIELLRNIISGSRFVRYRRSLLSVAVIMALGGMLGAIGEWFGSQFVNTAEKDMMVAAWLILGFSFVLILLFGFGIPIFFEKILSNLVKLKSDDETQ